MHLVPAGNLPKAVATDPEMLKKLELAAGCVCLTSPGYTSAEEVAWGSSCNTSDLWTCTEDAEKKWASLDYFNVYPESNGPVLVSGR